MTLVGALRNSASGELLVRLPIESSPEPTGKKVQARRIGPTSNLSFAFGQPY